MRRAVVRDPDDHEVVGMAEAGSDGILAWNVGMSGLVFKGPGEVSEGAKEALNFLAMLLEVERPAFVCLGEVKGTLKELTWLSDWMVTKGYDARAIPGPGGAGSCEKRKREVRCDAGLVGKGASAWRRIGALLAANKVKPHGGVRSICCGTGALRSMEGAGCEEPQGAQGAA